MHSVQRLSCHKQDFPYEILCRGVSWDVHTGMWAVPRCWAMIENITFQNWLLFLLVICTVSLNFSTSFCPVSEHFKTVNIFIVTILPWGGVGLHIIQIWRLSFDEHFFQQQHQHKHPLISPSPLPPLTHPSAVPVSVLCGKQITEHIQVKNSWKRGRERERNEFQNLG